MKRNIHQDSSPWYFRTSRTNNKSLQEDFEKQSKWHQTYQQQYHLNIFISVWCQKIYLRENYFQHRIPYSAKSSIKCKSKAKIFSDIEHLKKNCSPLQFISLQSLSCVRLFGTPWIAEHQASLFITNSQSLPKPMSIELVMPSSHLILCRPLLLLPPIPPSIRISSNESTLCMRWPKYWSFSLSISFSNEHPGLISFRMDWLDLLAVQGLSRVFSTTTVQKHQFFGTQISSQSNSHIHTWPLEKP